MNFKFTKYSLTNSLYSLIPIFPTWTLFPGVLTAKGVEFIIKDCETSYKIVYALSILLTIILIYHYLKKVNFLLLKKERYIIRDFRIWNLNIYALVNTFSIIQILGFDEVCHGSSTAFLACIISGPIASLSIILFGIIMDIKNNWR